MAGWIWKVQLWWENIHVLRQEKEGQFSSPTERREKGEVDPRA